MIKVCHSPIWLQTEKVISDHLILLGKQGNKVYSFNWTGGPVKHFQRGEGFVGFLRITTFFRRGSDWWRVARQKGESILEWCSIHSNCIARLCLNLSWLTNAAMLPGTTRADVTHFNGPWRLEMAWHWMLAYWLLCWTGTRGDQLYLQLWKF